MAKTKFLVYANTNDGRGIVRQPKTFLKKETAESEVKRLLVGKTHASRAYAIPARPGDSFYPSR